MITTDNSVKHRHNCYLSDFEVYILSMFPRSLLILCCRYPCWWRVFDINIDSMMSISMLIVWFRDPYHYRCDWWHYNCWLCWFVASLALLILVFMLILIVILLIAYSLPMAHDGDHEPGCRAKGAAQARLRPRACGHGPWSRADRSHGWHIGWDWSGPCHGHRQSIGDQFAIE